MRHLHLLLVLCHAAFSHATQARFDGDKVLRFAPTTRAHAQALWNLVESSNDTIIAWSETNVQVPAARVDELRRFAVALGMPAPPILIEDVQALVDMSSLRADRRQQTAARSGASSSFHEDFHTFDEISAFASTVTHLFMTPTTVYVAADVCDRHSQPA